MHVNVSTLQILEKRFKPEDARAIAEAIDDAIEEGVSPAKLVTDDSLKFHLTDLEGRLKLQLSEIESRGKIHMAEMETRLFARMAVLGLTGTGLIITTVFFMVLNLKK